MSKHKILTQDEIDEYKLNPILTQMIEDYISLQKLNRDQINILDWGSGRGRTVAKLREQGYCAYGVEIDPLPYNNGLPYFKSRYENPTEFLKLIDDRCLTAFPDNKFDIVFSEQVLEHVADLQLVADEMSRITKLGGKHLHRFPFKWHLVEQHLFMPAIHWLPKNWMRFCLIYFYTLLEVDPHWQELSKNSILDRARKYYEYSINKTYYRTIRTLKKTFEEHSFTFKFIILKHKHNIKRINSFFPYAIEVYLSKE